MKIQDKPYCPNQQRLLLNSNCRVGTASVKPLESEIVPLELNLGSDSLREQILAIQRAKALLGLENLAASELDTFWASNRIQIATTMGSRNPPRWSDFEKLNQRLYNERSPHASAAVMQTITWAMAEIVEKIDPSEIRIWQYSGSHLMTCAKEDPNREMNFVLGNKHAAINASIALSIIVQKIGNKLSDEAKIIRMLLEAPVREVHMNGAIVALNTYKHDWRKNISETGLIPALKREQDDEVRNLIANAITSANPKLILETHYVGSTTFRPIERVLTDTAAVRVSISHGIQNLMLAQVSSGEYYSDFQEIPYLSVQDKIDCFDYSLKVFEQVYSNSYFNKYETCLLANSSTSIVVAANDNSVLGRSDGERLIVKLSQMDLVKFVTSISKFDFFSEAVPVIDRILLTRAKTHEKPLIHYFSLRDSLLKLKQKTSNHSESSRIGICIQKVDNAIKDYLIHTEVKKWGDYTDFNLTASNLLDLLKETKDNSCRLAILSLFMALHTDGVQLKNHEPLEKALDNDNKTKLRNALRVIVYSGTVSPAFFSNTQAVQSTSFFKQVSNSLKAFVADVTGEPDMLSRHYALNLYRTINRSLKDYFGMADLKQRMLETASKSLESRSPAGILLSGMPGAGKSLLAEVLANEMALPLRMLLPRDVSGEKGQEPIIIQAGKRYSLQEYFESLKRGGSCVFLADEVDEIFSPKEVVATSAFLNFFKDLQDLRISIIVIATTNRPILDNLYGITIDSGGSSSEMSRLMAQYVNPNLFQLLRPYYTFHTKLVGHDFAKDHINHLIRNNQVKGSCEEPEFKKACTYARGLTPYTIEQCIAGIKNPTVVTVMNELKTVKLNRSEISETAEMIEIIVERLAMEPDREIQGQIDYKELALVAEDIPPKVLAEIIRNGPRIFEHDNLMRLLIEYKGNN